MKTTTLETSKRLKELGVEIESYFSWWKSPKGGHLVAENFDTWTLNEDHSPFIKVAPAHLADELAEVLPRKVQEEDGELCLNIVKTDIGYQVHYQQVVVGFGYEMRLSASTLAEAMGLMLIHLIENGYIDTNPSSGKHSPKDSN